MNKQSIIYTLTKFNDDKWFSLFDRLFYNYPLPKPFIKKSNNLSDFLVDIYRIIDQSKNLDLLNKYRSILLNYYFSLPLTEEKYSTIYTLHWVFGSIKIRISEEGSNTSEENTLTEQFLSGELKQLSANGINLHTSLLALLSNLPLVDKESITENILASSNWIIDYSFYRVALRFLIRNNLGQYFKLFEDISKSNKLETSPIAKVLAESLIDINTIKGTFKTVVGWMIRSWDNYILDYPPLSEALIDSLNKKLKYGSPHFDKKVCAHIIKLIITSKCTTQQPPIFIVDTIKLMSSIPSERQQITDFSIIREYINASRLVFHDQFLLSVNIENDSQSEIIYGIRSVGITINENISNLLHLILGEVPSESVIKSIIHKNKENYIRDQKMDLGFENSEQYYQPITLTI